jgi:hypothetical protein
VFADAGRGYLRCVPRPEAEHWPEAASWRTLAQAAVASRPQAPAAQLVCPAAAPAVGRIAGHHGGFRRQTLVDQVRSGPEMQRPEELSEAHPELLLAAMTEEHWEAARLSAVVAQAVQDVPREAAVRDEPLVVVEAAQDAPREAAAVRDVPLVMVVVAAQDVPREAAEVRDVPLAVVAAQDVPPEAAEVRDVPLAVVAAQDVPPEAAEVRDERLAGLPSVAEPSVAEPSVAPQVLSLLAARLARQRATLPPRGPEVTRFERSRSQSLRAGSIEFVSC